MSTFARIDAVSSLVLDEETLPDELGPDQVQVDITYCGICATDTHNYTSGGQIPPATFGHEWTGTISRVGASVSSVRDGDRVIAAVGPACGTCAMCRAGHADHCDLSFAEANGVTLDAPAHGGFASTLVVSERRVVPVIDGVSDVEAALVEPTAVTFHAVRRARQSLGAVVVVQGAGPIGLLTAQHARHAGAGRLLVIEPNADRRAAATALEFSDVVAPGDTASAWIDEVTSGLGADVLYECTGAATLLKSSSEMVRRGGTLALLGFPMTDSQISYGDWQVRELTVIGSLAYTHDDFLGAMRAIADGSVQVESLHTATIGLSELAAMLDELDSGDTSQTKVLLDPPRSGE
ncbi:zinc-dependent alcohol dehydrogenase [Aeromicrobium sp. CF3.5]|uniref:zinc-dependent alcohol dehydrogenase n=1 Tax=Aeromicrobium sp. CF3.5 TaxID=3373078 RepID=UPI003EE48EAC